MAKEMKNEQPLREFEKLFDAREEANRVVDVRKFCVEQAKQNFHSGYSNTPRSLSAKELVKEATIIERYILG